MATRERIIWARGERRRFWRRFRHNVIAAVVAVGSALGVLWLVS